MIAVSKMLILALEASAPAMACLPGPEQLRPSSPEAALEQPRRIGREAFTPSPDQLRLSRANPPPEVGPLQPCDHEARIQSGSPAKE